MEESQLAYNKLLLPVRGYMDGTECQSHDIRSSQNNFYMPLNCYAHSDMRFFTFLFQDVSDAQWRNFRGNLPILSIVFGIFTVVACMFRALYCLKAKGMSIVWLLISMAYLSYLHGAWYVLHLFLFLFCDYKYILYLRLLQ